MKQVTLEGELNRELKRWRFATMAYGFTYYGSRILLIALSAVVAAKESMAESVIDGLKPWIPLFAVVVAVLAALDTWLKPADKWRGFMESRDKLVDLVVRSGAGLDEDKVRLEFKELRSQHREKNVF